MNFILKKNKKDQKHYGMAGYTVCVCFCGRKIFLNFLKIYFDIFLNKKYFEKQLL
jgi:hypothetical protein